MFDSGNNEANGERQGYVLTPVQVLEQLEKEMRLLNDEKDNLLDIEAKLWFMINEKIEAQIRKNQVLRLEVEKRKMNCVELARGLNASIRETCSTAVG